MAKRQIWISTTGRMAKALSTARTMFPGAPNDSQALTELILLLHERYDKDTVLSAEVKERLTALEEKVDRLLDMMTPGK